MEFAHLHEKEIEDRASAVRRDRARAGIPGEGAGLKGTASASAETLRLVGVVLLLVFTMMWPVFRIRLVAGGCLRRLMVVDDQLTGRIVCFLGEGQIRMEYIP